MVFNEAVKRELFGRFDLERQGVYVSYLQFVDDTLIIGKKNWRNVWSILNFKVKLLQSQLVGINTTKSNQINQSSEAEKLKQKIVEGLKYNLFSTNQFCDNEFIAFFIKRNDNTTLFTAKINNNLYNINLEDLNRETAICLVFKEDEIWL
ncbi:hypothetical protein CR513_49359, partial [Mucuna pruriens]